MKSNCLLLADEHHIMLEGVRSLLETMFKSVVMVADADSLLNTVSRLKPDLIIVDLSLTMPAGKPHIVGELKQQYPEIKVIVLSVHDEQTVLQSILDAGAVGYVLKRSASTDLIPAVEAALQGRTYISPALQVESDS